MSVIDPVKRYTFQADTVYTVTVDGHTHENVRWVRDITDRDPHRVCLHGFVPADSRKRKPTVVIYDCDIVSVTEH